MANPGRINVGTNAAVKRIGAKDVEMLARS